MSAADHPTPRRAADVPFAARREDEGPDEAQDEARQIAPGTPQDSFLRRALGPYAQHPRSWADRQVAFVTLAFLALLYLGLYHPYWARGGDSELYLVVARNLVTGQGYTYNGQPVALVPPLWSIVIAAGMWFTSVVGILKLMMPALFLVYAGCAYLVLRRIASPWVAAASVALTCGLYGLIILTMWFHSDALFFALSWASLLLALQAGERYAITRAERRSWLWRAVAAILLLMAAVATRWPGVLWMPIVGLAFLNGRALVRSDGPRRLSFALRPTRIDAMWLCAVLAGVATAVAFFGLRLLLKVDPADVNPQYDAFVTGRYDLVNQHARPTISTHIHRLLRGPEWLSALYWSELGRDSRFALAFSRIAAVTAIPLAVAGLVGLYRRQWVWLGVAAAWVPIVATWPHAIDRYSGPVAPFLICGTVLGTVWLSKAFDRRFADRPALRVNLRRVPYVVMAVPLLICLTYNTGRYGLEVWARLSYLERYEGGIQPRLNQIAAHVRQNAPVFGGEVAVTRTGVRPGNDADAEEQRFQKVRGVQRNFAFLAGGEVMDVPALWEFDPATDEWFVEWAAENRVRYLVVMPRHRRFFVHLRDLPDWALIVLRMLRPDEPPYPPLSLEQIAAENYILYEVIGGDLGLPVAVRAVDVTAWPAEVSVVPGLEDVRTLGPKRSWLPIPYN